MFRYKTFYLKKRILCCHIQLIFLMNIFLGCRLSDISLNAISPIKTTAAEFFDDKTAITPRNSFISIESFGICEPNPYHLLSKPTELIAEAGFRWVRLSAFWDQIEAEKNIYDFTLLDHSVNLAISNGLKIVMQIHPFFPQWIPGNEEERNCWIDHNCSYLPPDLIQFRKDIQKFTETIVRRYHGKVQYYTVWSEPDGKWFFRGTSDQYIENILQPVSEKIRSIDEGIKILGPGIFTNNGFLRNVLNKTCNDIDIISVHSYSGNTVKSRIDKLKNYSKIAIEECNKPIWLTEFGFDDKIIGEKNTGSLLTKIMSEALKVPNVKKVFMYRMSNAPEAPNGYGITEVHPFTDKIVRHKPAFNTVKSFLKQQLFSDALTFETYVSFTNSINGLQTLTANFNQENIQVYFAPSKTIKIRNLTNPSSQISCRFSDPMSDLYAENSHKNCLNNKEYTFQAKQFPETWYFDISVYHQDQIIRRRIDLHPIDNIAPPYSLKFQITYTNIQGEQQVTVADDLNKVAIVNYDKNKPFSLTVLSDKVNATCRYTAESLNGQFSDCTFNNTYNFDANSYSQPTYFHIKAIYEGYVFQRGIRLIPK